MSSDAENVFIDRETGEDVQREDSSPFEYHGGMMLVNEGGKDVSLPFMNKKMGDGTLPGMKYDVLETVYRYTYLTRHVLVHLLNGMYPGRNAKNVIGWLVNYGFLQRISGKFGNRSTPYFYTVGTGVAEFMKKGNAECLGIPGRIAIKGKNIPLLPDRNDSATAMWLLARNQFVSAAVESRLFVRDEAHTPLVFNDAEGRKKCIDLGYSAVFKCIRKKGVFELRLIAIPVRRSPGWEDDVVRRLKLALRYSQKRDYGYSLPICICEDHVHMDSLADLAKKDAVIKTMDFLMCTDYDTFDKRYYRDGASADDGTGETSLSCDIADNLFHYKPGYGMGEEKDYDFFSLDEKFLEKMKKMREKYAERQQD